MDRNMREALAGHEHYDRTAEFCAKDDDPAFDAKRETLPLAHFEPMVRRVFAQPKNTIDSALKK